MSRLTSLAPGQSVKTAHLAAFNFRDMGGWHLITNEWGHFLMLEPPDFKKLMAGTLTPEDPVHAELAQRGFLRDQIEFKDLAKSYIKKNSYHYHTGPNLHMIVVTLRCNQKCQYCHSSVVDPSRTDTDMDLKTAKATVDFIFKTTNPTICIEFQGGEPLLNWPIVKFITLYARAKAKATGRKLIIALVSNFTLMSDERLEFFLDQKVSLCTSLDGPSNVHDRNRPFLGGGLAQEKVVAWLKRLQVLCSQQGDKRYYLPGALMTTTRYSLPYGKEIVDLYVELGLEQIFIRPLSPIGYAKRVWPEMGYAPEEFIAFYEKTLDYILELNKKGTVIMERMALVMLAKVIKNEDPGYMDMRSPAGAVLGCLAYNYNGEIYVSDEGRMVEHQGDPIFRVGDVCADGWSDVVDHPTTRTCATASLLENQPMCNQCAYKPYCGIDPVFHYETQNSVFGQMPSSPWCRSHMGLFDVLFKKLRDPEARKIFDDWMVRDECQWEENKAPAETMEVAR